jgi:hypothetical protein
MATLALAVVPGAAAAQEWRAFTPEEFAQRASEAEAAPLFKSQEPLVLTLRADISWLRDERSDEEQTEGSVVLPQPDGTEVVVPVKVRTRGIFRRDKRNCNFPPLRLNFPKKQVKGTVFESQDKVKLVTPCRDNNDTYQQYVLQEYLVYRVAELLTPASFRVRLVRITYEDPDGGYDPRTKLAFLIEDDEQMAARNRAQVMDWEQFHPARMDPEHAVLESLFQYMIGNTDYSAPFFHNSTLVRTEDARYLPVPYDFDFSGVVNARYATPDPSLEIRSVRERIYRGFCRPSVDFGKLVALFNEKRDAIRALYEGMPDLEEKQRSRVLEYYDDFYEIINDPTKLDRRVIRACRDFS